MASGIERLKEDEQSTDNFQTLPARHFGSRSIVLSLEILNRWKQLKHLGEFRSDSEVAAWLLRGDSKSNGKARIRSSDGPSATLRCGSVLDKFIESKDAPKNREFEHELIVSREGKQQSQERLPDERSLLQRSATDVTNRSQGEQLCVNTPRKFTVEQSVVKNPQLGKHCQLCSTGQTGLFVNNCTDFGASFSVNSRAGNHQTYGYNAFGTRAGSVRDRSVCRTVNHGTNRGRRSLVCNKAFLSNNSTPTGHFSARGSLTGLPCVQACEHHGPAVMSCVYTNNSSSAICGDTFVDDQSSAAEGFGVTTGSSSFTQVPYDNHPTGPRDLNDEAIVSITGIKDSDIFHRGVCFEACGTGSTCGRKHGDLYSAGSESRFTYQADTVNNLTKPYSPSTFEADDTFESESYAALIDSEVYLASQEEFEGVESPNDFTKPYSPCASETDTVFGNEEQFVSGTEFGSSDFTEPYSPRASETDGSIEIASDDATVFGSEVQVVSGTEFGSVESVSDYRESYSPSPSMYSEVANDMVEMTDAEGCFVDNEEVPTNETEAEMTDAPGYLADEPNENEEAKGALLSAKAMWSRAKSNVRCPKQTQVPGERRAIVSLTQLRKIFGKTCKKGDCSAVLSSLKETEIKGCVVEFHWKCTAGHQGVWATDEEENDVYAFLSGADKSILFGGPLSLERSWLFSL